MGKGPLPNARKPGKRYPADSGKGKGGKDLPINPKLDPSKVESFPASCPDCGSLGAYLNQGDATRAEQTHQQRVHSNSPQKKTTSVAEQNRRNKGGGK